MVAVMELGIEDVERPLKRVVSYRLDVQIPSRCGFGSHTVHSIADIGCHTPLWDLLAKSTLGSGPPSGWSSATSSATLVSGFEE